MRLVLLLLFVLPLAAVNLKDIAEDMLSRPIPLGEALLQWTEEEQHELISLLKTFPHTPQTIEEWYQAAGSAKEANARRIDYREDRLLEIASLQ